jgi:AcrR family transcriptional regulator
MSMATKRRSAAGDRRNRDPEIITAAIQVFHQKGFSAASLQDVADIVGVLKGSLYHYISSKEELLFRIIDGSHVQANVIMDHCMQVSDDPMVRLHRYLTDMATWYLDNIERVSIYFNDGRWLTGERLDQVRKQRREFDAFLRSLIEGAQRGGHVRQDVDVRLSAQLMLGALNSVSNWYRPDGLYSPEEIAGMFRDMMLTSLTGAVPRLPAGEAVRDPTRSANDLPTAGR